MSMHGGMRGGSIRSFAKDPSVRSHRVGRETARRVLGSSAQDVAGWDAAALRRWIDDRLAAVEADAGGRVLKVRTAPPKTPS